jgi:hypothetical protein
MESELKTFNFNVELSDQRKLFVECFPETVGTPDETVAHYSWKFQSAEHIPHSFEFGAYQGSQIIGYYAAIPYRYYYFQKEIVVAMVCDVMTGIAARGKGIFVKLGIYSNQKFKEAGLKFSSGFPIRPEVIPGHLKVGWNILFDLPLYTRFLRFDSFLKSKKMGFLIPLFNLGAHIYSSSVKCFFKKQRNLQIHHFSSLDGFDKIEGFFEFLNEWEKEIPISLIKDRPFMNWRFAAPGKEYNISILRSNNKIVGYAISRFTVKQTVPSVGIVDVAILNGFYELSYHLFQDIERYAKEKGAEFIFMMISNFWSKKYKIWQGGFLKTAFKFKYIFKNLNFDAEDTRHTDSKNWHLMWIDSDDL